MRWDDEKMKELEEFARRVRRDIVQMTYLAQSGHPGGSLSCVEMLTMLYQYFMRHRPKDPLWSGRDRLIFSKGHASLALYSVLARSGYFDPAELAFFRHFGSRLQGHPVSQSAEQGVPGVEFPGGSLGQGISFGIGQALAMKRKRSRARVFVIASDGELQEGQSWEALISAPKDWANTAGVEGASRQKPIHLDNLFLLVDLNGMQNDTRTQDTLPQSNLYDQLSAAGWRAQEVFGGNNMQSVYLAMRRALIYDKTPKPHVLLFHTVKGKGVSFMENAARFHGEPPNKEEFIQAMTELGGAATLPRLLPRRDNTLFKRAQKGTRDAFGDAVNELEEFYAVAADLGKSTRFSRVAQKHPRRCFNVGIQEQNMAGIAAGLAAEGSPVFCYTFANFHEIALERIKQQIAIPNANVKILASHRGLSPAQDGKSRQTVEDIALFRAMPNMRVVVPADYNEAMAVIRAAYRTYGPWYIAGSRENFPLVHNQWVEFRPGGSIIYTTPYRKADLCIVACGLMCSFAQKAAAKIEKELNIGVRVVNLAQIKPLYLNKIADCTKILVCEEHSFIGGLYSAVCEGMQRHGFSAQVSYVALEDQWGQSGSYDDLLRNLRLTADDIFVKAKGLIL